MGIPYRLSIIRVNEIGAYVGTGILKDIGTAIYEAEQLKTLFEDLERDRDEQPDPTRWERFKSMDFPPSPLQALTLQIQPFAEYYGMMDKLDVNMNALLTYLELIRTRSVRLERRLFAGMDLRNQYNQFDPAAAAIPDLVPATDAPQQAGDGS